MRNVLFACLFCWSLTAQEHKTPEQIQQQLDEAEQQFERAIEMFNPWYTGPLLTPSASMVAPGSLSLQPYVFISDNYAAYNEDRTSVPLAHNLINLNPVLILQTGITQSMDSSVTIQTNTNWQNGHSGSGFGDTQATVGFLIQPQTLYVPKVKFSIQETFPTGRYQNLHADGLNGSGSGAYQTQFSLAAGKTMFWATKHPISARIALAYKISTAVSVRNFNSYGGGLGTRGTVYPGNTFSADFGLEVSLTQRWVFATDVVYTATERTSFSGTSTAAVGSGYKDQLSLAPAIEYNWSENLGVLAGAQFTVYGRNSSNFASAILSVSWTFP